MSFRRDALVGGCSNPSKMAKRWAFSRGLLSVSINRSNSGWADGSGMERVASSTRQAILRRQQDGKRRYNANIRTRAASQRVSVRKQPAQKLKYCNHCSLCFKQCRYQLHKHFSRYQTVLHEENLLWSDAVLLGAQHLRNSSWIMWSWSWRHYDPSRRWKPLGHRASHSIRLVSAVTVVTLSQNCKYQFHDITHSFQYYHSVYLWFVTFLTRATLTGWPSNIYCPHLCSSSGVMFFFISLDSWNNLKRAAAWNK